MNEMFETQSVGEQQRWIDRLIDGELTQDQQRQLILSLEAQPDGWRRCALAFLEAQSWGRQFQALASCRPEAVSTLVVKPVVGDQHSRKLLRMLTIAAGLMIAFTLGLASTNFLPAGGHDLQSSPVGSDGRVIAAAAPSETQESTAGKTQPRKWETLKVTIPSADGESDQTLELPLVEGDEKTLASLLAEQKPVLSDLELKTLQSTGHEIEQHRAYYPVQLEDGRQAVLPMDLVEVKYTGGWQ